MWNLQVVERRARECLHGYWFAVVMSLIGEVRKLTAPKIRESAEICEDLVRHLETTGEDVFEKCFVQGGKTRCVVFCMIGEDAEEFLKGTQAWLADHGYNRDPKL
jgi:hypothetical protein